MMPEEPRRLSQDPALRDVLEAARADLPEPARLARIEGLLLAKGAAVAATGAGHAGASAAGAVAKGGLLWKVGLGIALIVATAGTTAMVLSREPAVGAVGLVPARGTGLPSAPVGTEPDLGLAPPVPSPPADATASPTARASSVATPTTTAASPKPPEMELLNAAQRALATKPSEALAHCDELARLYPRGMMVEERERIAIEALVSLGRRSEAQRRAAAFHRSFPRSSYGPRLDAILGK